MTSLLFEGEHHREFRPGCHGPAGSSRVADATIKSWVDQLADGIVGLDGNDDLNNGAPSMLRRDRNVTAEPKGPGPQVTEAHART